ncbi:MAG: glycosyltransferase family 2 protein [Candidatus Moranbacteria bacterium]|nr:glycosyltransferase family 2 protein [Candidatus Moranbacteria bacterium]
MSSTIPKKPKIFVIILNYNGGTDLLKTIKSVVDSNYQNLEIILVDNNSTDNSLNLAEQWVATHCSSEKNFSKIYFIKNKKNLGFGAGNNVGIKFAFENSADYVFLLNNDALVRKNTISKLIDSIKDESEIGLVSPVIYSDLKYKNIWFCGGKINWWKMRAEHFDCISLFGRKWFQVVFGRERFQTVPYTDVEETEYVTGCAMLISKKVFEKVGLFDEFFFLYYEDADLSLRVKKAELKNLIVPSAKVYHQEQSEENQSQKIYWLVLSGILFFRKHGKGFWKIYLNIYLFLRKLKNYLDVKFRPTKINLAVRRAYLDVKN